MVKMLSDTIKLFAMILGKRFDSRASSARFCLNMKTFSLLWLNGAGSNECIAMCKAANLQTATGYFGLASDYVKFSNGGAWCVAQSLNWWE